MSKASKVLKHFTSKGWVISQDMSMYTPSFLRSIEKHVDELECISYIRHDDFIEILVPNNSTLDLPADAYEDIFQSSSIDQDVAKRVSDSLKRARVVNPTIMNALELNIMPDTEPKPERVVILVRKTND
jgi:hypothetical protein